MRRIVAFIAALALVASIGGSTLAADPAPRSSFHGDFDLLAEDGTLLGHANAQLFPPTDQRLVPGRFDFEGAAGNPILESHAVIGDAHFWFDPVHLSNGATIPGAYVARGEGVECVYLAANDTDCHEWAVQYVDNVDPAVRDEAMFFGYWGVATQFIGDGAFVLRFSGTES